MKDSLVWKGLWWVGLLATLIGCSTSAESDPRSADMEVPNPAARPNDPSNSGPIHNSPMPGGQAPSGAAGASSGGPGSSPQLSNPPSNEGDKYTAPGTQPFVYTAHDPLSTFAVDVDTASYDLFRRDVNLGIRPQPASVRLEEYVNNFEYDYPAPEDGDEHPFAIALAAGPSVFDRDTVMLRVGIQGMPPPNEKKPANLVFLVDVSGSMMSADKLPLAQQVLMETIGILDPTDTISIVTYAGSTAVRLGPTPASERGTIEDVIGSLQASGGTAGGAGLNLAYEQAARGFVEGGINHVILCTDGDFNIGPSSNKELLALIRDKRESGVTLTVLGFGIGNLNDSMMEAISNAGNGIYGVISSPQQASEYVANKMLSTLVHIAKDMKIQVEFNPEEVVAYRLLGYENRALADDDFRDDAVDAGEIGAGHRVTALYELVLRGGDVPVPEGAPKAIDGDTFDGETEVDASDLVLVKVRYKTPGASESDAAFEVAATLAPEAIAEGISDLDLDFQWALGVASFAEILKGSPYADPARLETIETIIQRPGHLEYADRAEFVQLFQKAQSLGIP